YRHVFRESGRLRRARGRQGLSDDACYSWFCSIFLRLNCVSGRKTLITGEAPLPRASSPGGPLVLEKSFPTEVRAFTITFSNKQPTGVQYAATAQKTNE